jgi:hypothetical protein
MKKPSLREINKLEAALEKTYEDERKLELLRLELIEQIKRAKDKAGESVTVEKRKSSLVMTRDDGLAITLPRKRNRFGTYQVKWYDGKALDTAIQDCTFNWRDLQVWLACA